MQLLNTAPTISRSQLLADSLGGVIRDHEPFVATLNPRGLVYTAELLRGIERFSGAVSLAERELAEASAATAAYTETLQRGAIYARDLRAEIVGIGGQIKNEGDAAGAAALRADYTIRQTRLSLDRPSDIRSVIDQYAHANTKHRALLLSWGVPAERLDEAGAIAQQLPDALQLRRTETTEAELAIRERDDAELAFIAALNPLLRRLPAYAASQPEAVAAFESVINKFRDDLTSDPDEALT
jgi:hypothetical protein